MELQEWRAVAASAVGTSHVKIGAPCQDSFRCRLFNEVGREEVTVLIASDGAGSAKYSDVGSDLACQELLDNVALFLTDDHRIGSLTKEKAREWMSNVVDAIAHRAEMDGNSPRDYACTLLAALVSPTHAAYLQIGDGAIVVRADEDQWCYVFWPQHGEFINSTVFLTDPSSLEKFEFEMRADAVHEIAAFTDGIEALVLQYATHTVHGPFFNRMLPAVRASPVPGYNPSLSEKLAEYLGSEAVCQRTDDDKTLLLASRIKTL